MGLLVNIDNGGTFTDVCIRSESSVIHSKSPTTPHDLTQCFVESLRRASAKLYGEEDLGRLMRECDYLRYSTTAGTNAVVERKGTPAALVVEAGAEKDAYGARAAIEGGLWDSLVQGEPVGLKVGKDGAIDPKELTAQINAALAGGAQRLVIAMRSEANERAIKALLLEKYPRHLLGAIPFLLSYELMADNDHARRTVTALLNSYLHPGMEHFLFGAERACKTNRLQRPLLIFRNDGDSARVAKTTAVKTWGSGPRGGVEGAIAYAKRYKAKSIVGMDIGGTTTDVACAVDGAIRRNAFGVVEGATISLPLPEMHSYGLGGSSIIRAVSGLLTVGPESVGAAPGPACFARGGTEATLTDALLLAGIIDGENYLGGELKLDTSRAVAAITQNVAEPLKLSLDGAVGAIIETFADKVGTQLRSAVEAAGQTCADTTLLAFGGGGPMIVTAIADAIGIRRVIVPHKASVFSAYGIGFSHLAHEYRTHSVTGAGLEKAKQDMLARARMDMFGEGVDPDTCDFVFMAETNEDGALVEHPLGATMPAGAVLSLKAVHRLPTFTMSDAAPSSAPLREIGKTTVFLGAGEKATVPVFADIDLAPGHKSAGPALIRGEYLTCLIGPNWRFEVSPNNDIVLEAGK